MLPEGMSEQVGSSGEFDGHLCLVAPHRVSWHAMAVGLQTPTGKLILLCKVFFVRFFLLACFSLTAEMGKVLKPT